MGSTEAKRYVIAFIVWTGLMVALYRLNGKEDRDASVRMGIGVAISAVVLSFLAELAPMIAATLAATVALGTTLSLGSTVFAALARTSGGKK